jgi:PAS domain S-box-containing protein/diguanylate cyclase (GGDEF)-like protein
MADNKTAHRILRLLILDDSPDDTEQASAALRQAGYMLKSQRLETGVAVEQNLESGNWDLVLCAHGVASLPARQVVELVARKQPFVPAIVLARRIGDDELRTLMAAGARDVIIKGQWGRLAPAVERELATAAERRGLHDLRAAMSQLEARYRTMIEASIEAISYVQDGMHMDANAAYLRLFGYENLDQLKEIPLLNLIDKQDQARFKAALRKPEGAEKPQEFAVVTAAGSRISIEVALTPLTISGEPSVQVVATDISKRKALEHKLQSMRQRDSLTGLYNRAHFLGALDETLKTRGGVLIGLTVNNLSQLNHNLGHSACDQMLAHLGRELRDLAGNQALVARVAGGQFAVLLGPKAAADADDLAKRIADMLRGLTAGEGDSSTKPDISLTPLRLDAQAGDRQQILDRIFKRDVTMVPAATPTKAAAQPPAPTSAAGPAAPAPTAMTVDFTSDWGHAIRDALARNRLQLMFQPIINLHGEPRYFYEAQLMLPSADGTLVSKEEYLPPAEAAGLGGKLDRTMMLNVIDALSKHQVEGRPGIAFAHLSSAAIQDGALLAAIQMHMKATGVDASNIILQLEEASVAAHIDAARVFIQKARAMGLGVAIDNFGGQLLNVEVLAGLEIDFLALNCGPTGLSDDALFNAIDTALAVDKQTVARDIHDAEIFSTLFARGVHYVQGDYLQAASTGLDYSFEAEQTLASDEPPAPSWRATG